MISAIGHPTFDLIITGATVATAERVTHETIAVQGGRIVARVAPGIELEATETIEATGKIVIPGGVDPHVHFHGRLGTGFNRDDFDNGTVAAAIGGTTSFINFVGATPEESGLEALQHAKERASRLAAIDFGFHLMLTDRGQQTLDGLSAAVAYGVPSFKMFMTYRKEGIFSSDGLLMEVMAESARLGALPMVHAENQDVIERRTAKLLADGETSAMGHLLSRPAYTEAEAIRRAAFLARAAGSALYVVHISSRDGQAAVGEARAQGQAVYGETCTHYLALTDAVYQRENGIDYIVSPPIRGVRDQDALWTALRTQVLATVGSDDCAYDTVQRRQFGLRFDQIPNGAAGVEVRLPLLYGLGVVPGRLSLQEFVSVSSTNTARLFGLYPTKGSLEVGADADIVIIDPEREMTLAAASLHMGVDHSMYEGMRIKGCPVVTIARGMVVARDGQFVGQPGAGRYIARSIDPAVLQQPQPDPSEDEPASLRA